jgi:hypothetical protein
LPPNTPELVIALVDGNTVQPREKRTPRIELRKREIDFGKDFLRYILDFVAGTQIVIGEIENGLLILSHKLFKCKGIPFLASANHVAVIVWVWFLQHKADPIFALQLLG